MTDSVIFQRACVKLPYFYFRSETCRSTCVTVPNFVAIDQTVVEIWRFFDFFQDGGRPPSWVCDAHISTIPMKGIWWSLSPCKIWLESIQ